MATKIFVHCNGLSKDKAKAITQRIADALCVCPEDVLVLPEVQGITVVDVPDKVHEKKEAKQEPKEASKPTALVAHKEL